MANFKEIYHFSRFQRGSNVFQGIPAFSRGWGSNCLFPIETHITCDFPEGGEKNSICYLAHLAEGTGLRLALSETQKTGFLASWPVLLALGQIFQVQQIIILKTNIMRRLFIGYIYGNHII